jgi:hypothetical protein
MLLRRILFLAVFAAPVAARAAEPELKTVATFAKGEVELKHGGTPIKWKLKDGTMQSMSFAAGGTRMEMVNFTLSYYEDPNPRSTNQDRVEINLGNIPGPGKYPKSSIEVFAVFSKAGTSIFRSSKGTDCTFQLSKADAKGIVGSATCKGDFADFGGKGAGPKVDEVKFSATP